MYVSRFMLFVIAIVSWVFSGYLYSVNLGLEAKLHRLSGNQAVASNKDMSLGELATGSIRSLIKNASEETSTDDNWKGNYIVVKEGDTLLGIANRHNKSAPLIARLNRIKSPYRLRVGQRILMP